LHETERIRCDETETTWQQREYRQERRDEKYSEKEKEEKVRKTGN
jgi:hypothetical protein